MRRFCDLKVPQDGWQAAAKEIWELRTKAVEELLEYRRELPKRLSTEQKDRVAFLNGVVAGLAKATHEFEVRSNSPWSAS